MGRFQTPRQQKVQGQTYVHINIYSKNDDQLIIRASALSAPSLNQYHIDSRSYHTVNHPLNNTRHTLLSPYHQSLPIYLTYPTFFARLLTFINPAIIDIMSSFSPPTHPML